MRISKTSLHSSPKISIKYKILTAFLFLAVLLIGGAYYAKVQVKKCIRQQNYEISINSSHIGWKGWGLPNLTFKKVEIQNKDPKAGLRNISVEKVFFQPSFISFVKSYLRGYEFLFSIQDLKINKHTENYVEVDDTQGVLANNKDVYSIKSLKLSPLRFGLTESYTTPPAKPEERQEISHLVLYEINCNGEYTSSNQDVKLDLYIPPAKLQMPEGRTYEVRAKGGFQLLETSSTNKSKSKSTPVALPAQGEIKFTINGFSNFLSHLHQVRAISLLAANIGTIVGYFVERSMEDAVELDLNMQKDGAYIKGIKIYP